MNPFVAGNGCWGECAAFYMAVDEEIVTYPHRVENRGGINTVPMLVTGISGIVVLRSIVPFDKHVGSRWLWNMKIVLWDALVIGKHGRATIAVATGSDLRAPEAIRRATQDSRPGEITACQKNLGPRSTISGIAAAIACGIPVIIIRGIHSKRDAYLLQI